MLRDEGAMGASVWLLRGLGTEVALLLLLGATGAAWWLGATVRLSIGAGSADTLLGAVAALCRADGDRVLLLGDNRELPMGADVRLLCGAGATAATGWKLVRLLLAGDAKEAGPVDSIVLISRRQSKSTLVFDLVSLCV